MAQQKNINELKSELEHLKKAVVLERSIDKIRTETLAIKLCSAFEKILLTIFQEIQSFDLNIHTVHFHALDDHKKKDLVFWGIKQNGGSPLVNKVKLPYQDDNWFNSIRQYQLENITF